MSLNMSADTTPITPERFAAALPDLNKSTLYLKLLEIRNSLSHLQSSNLQLLPFATADPPDQICAEAIIENEQVIRRMQERVALIRADVQGRGISWEQFDDVATLTADGEESVVLPMEPKENFDEVGGDSRHEVNGEARERAHPAWSDGTFTVGTISGSEMRVAGQANGHTNIDSEAARREREAVLAQMEQELAKDEDEEEGIHL